MIYIERKITIRNNEAYIEQPIILYKGDKNIELQFAIDNNPFKHRSGTAVTYGQLIIKRPNAAPIFSEPAKLSSGKVLFTITGDMIDELNELGDYNFQIRIIDTNQTSRGTLPEVSGGIIIKEPLCEEAATNTTYVNNRNAYVMPGNDNIATFSLRGADTMFDEEGNYIKTEWAGGDIITDTRLNRVESALYEINDNIPTDYVNAENVIDLINSNNEFIEDYMDGIYTKQSDMYIYATTEYVSDYISDQEYVPHDMALDMISSNNDYLEGYLDTKYTTIEDVVDYVTGLDYIDQDRVLDMISSNNDYLEGYLDTKYATEEYINNSFATYTYVNDAINNIEIPEGGNVDLTGYATEQYVQDYVIDRGYAKLSYIEGDYITGVLDPRYVIPKDLNEYYTKTEIDAMIGNIEDLLGGI